MLYLHCKKGVVGDGLFFFLSFVLWGSRNHISFNRRWKKAITGSRCWKKQHNEGCDKSDKKLLEFYLFLLFLIAEKQNFYYKLGSLSFLCSFLLKNRSQLLWNLEEQIQCQLSACYTSSTGHSQEMPRCLPKPSQEVDWDGAQFYTKVFQEGIGRCKKKVEDVFPSKPLLHFTFSLDS